MNHFILTILAVLLALLFALGALAILADRRANRAIRDRNRADAERDEALAEVRELRAELAVRPQLIRRIDGPRPGDTVRIAPWSSNLETRAFRRVRGGA